MLFRSENGKLHIEWKGRSDSMPMVLATTSDEQDGSMRQFVATAGSAMRMLLGGRRGGGGGMVFRVSNGNNGNGGGMAIVLDGANGGQQFATQLSKQLTQFVLQQTAFGDNPEMRAGLHPYVGFGDVQLRIPPQESEAGRPVELNGGTFSFSLGDGGQISFGSGASGDATNGRNGGASAAAATSTAAGAGGPSVLRGGQQRSAGLRGLTAWQPLAGTEQEARQLAPLLGGGAVISGPAATASVVLGQRAPRILHIATHGFFLADQPFAEANAGGGPAATGPGGLPVAGGGAPAERSAPATPSREDPLQRSGLVFAGANRPEANPSDDGYLTAAEATAMDLEGTELVTLSACETGLGGVRSGEGVYGLQRSLAVAGARSTLLSLWKVDDGLTATFMQSFYQRLKAGEGRAEALRNTQAEFRDNKNSTYNDIRVWGAFQLSGDWRPLKGW